MWFKKKKPVGMFSFLAVAGNGRLAGMKDKEKLKKAIQNDVCPPLFTMAAPGEEAFRRNATMVYPWEWQSPTTLYGFYTPQEEYDRIWKAIFDYMKKKYDFDDLDYIARNATGMVSEDCAVFYFEV